jgi:2-polyprenyl-3-methyl-5-hydroxy-6-metoxy-1,4-benzoquinol methylase
MAAAEVWNANIHYHRLLLNAVPRGAHRVLDVGCGDGVLCAQLIKAGVQTVVGLEADAGVLGRARARHAAFPIEWTHDDLFHFQPAGGGFDAVLSVATLHHMDAGAGLPDLPN